jgi:hypothetical protein
MPIRRRPEAGFLLALASGRLPFRWRGGDRMTLLRRRPREVYRVYTEDEYLDGAELEVGAGPEVTAVGEWSVPVGPVRKGGGERRLRRVTGVAMLAGAVGTVGGLVVMTGSWTHRGAGRRPGSLAAAVRSPVVVGSSAVSTRPTVAGSSEATRSRGARAGRHDDASGADPHTNHPARLRVRRRGSGAQRVRPSHGPDTPPAGAVSHRAGGVTIVVDDPSGSRSGMVASADASAEGATATSSTGESTATDSPAEAATVHGGLGKPAEFGFER